MARLPIPGQDVGTWGAVLNDFLRVAHNSDGTIKAVAIPPASINDATPSAKGVIRLAGNLSGDANSPLVTSTSLTSALPMNQGGTGQTTQSGALNAILPAQSGNAGRVLQTNGSTASWQVASSYEATNDDLYAMAWMEV